MCVPPARDICMRVRLQYKCFPCEQCGQTVWRWSWPMLCDKGRKRAAETERTDVKLSLMQTTQARTMKRQRNPDSPSNQQEQQQGLQTNAGSSRVPLCQQKPAENASSNTRHDSQQPKDFPKKASPGNGNSGNGPEGLRVSGENRLRGRAGTVDARLHLPPLPTLPPHPALRRQQGLPRAGRGSPPPAPPAHTRAHTHSRDAAGSPVSCLQAGHRQRPERGSLAGGGSRVAGPQPQTNVYTQS